MGCETEWVWARGSMHALLATGRTSAAGAVAGVSMTVQAVELAIAAGLAAVNGLDQVRVTAPAVVHHDPPVAGRDLDRLLEVLQGERGRVAEALVGLGHPLGDAGGREMAIDAAG